MPALRLHKVKSSSAGPLPRPLSETEAAIDPIEDAALCFEASVNRAVHSRAPLADNRCYIYRSMGTQVCASQQREYPMGWSALPSLIWGG